MKLSKKHIRAIFSSYAKCWIERSLIKHHVLIYKQIMAQTDFLKIPGTNPTFFERLFCIENSISEKPKCSNCHQSYVKFNDKAYKYHSWCSASCQASDPNCISGSKETRMKKYGSENYNGAEKSRLTRFANNDGHWHPDDFGEKVKSRKIANGHDENWTNTEKAKQTISELIAENPDFWKDRENKTKQTKIANGKDANWNNREKFKETISNFSQEQKKHRSDALSKAYKSKTDAEKKDRSEKIKKSCIEEYGVFPTILNPDVKAKMIESCIRHNGVEYGVQTQKCKRARLDTSMRKLYNMLTSSELDYPMFEVKDLYAKNANPFIEYKFKCLKCGNTFDSYIGAANGLHGKCPICFPDPPAGTSRGEKELGEFLSQMIGASIIKRTRKYIKPLELDFVIPEKKLAVEYDGLFWHCADAPGEHDKNYHRLKTEMCENAGMRLIHVFEDEWIEKRRIVESRLKNILGIHEKTIFARKCKIDKIGSATGREFLDENHIQGPANASVNLGLFSENELVAIMTFSKCRFDKKHEWEMLRFCTKLGYHIPGAAGKLLKYFETTYCPKSLVTYADRRWSQGNLYKKLGFKLDHVSAPDYWYFKYACHRYSRIVFQKHKLKKLLKNFDGSKTEIENMKTNGWHQIFDCGNYVFEKNYIIS